MQGRSLTLGCLALLLSGVGWVEDAIAAPTVQLAQQKNNDIDIQLAKLDQEARLLHQRGEYSAALKKFEAGLHICEQINSVVCQAASLNNIGKIYNDQGEYSSALEYFKRALSITQNLNHSLIYQLLYNIAAAYSGLNNHRQALKSYQDALKYAEEPEEKILSVIGTGQAYEILGNYNAALNQYQMARKISRDSNRPLFWGTASSYMASLQNRLRQHDRAIELHQEVLKMAKSINDKGAYSSALNNLALSYSGKGEYAKALINLEEALAIAYDSQDSYNIAGRLINLGNIYFQENNTEAAIKYFQNALDISREKGYRELSVTSYGYLGAIYSHLGNHDLSLQYFQKELEQSSTPNNTAIALAHLAQVFESKNRPDLAIAFYKQAVNEYEPLRENIKFLSRNEQALYTQTIANIYLTLADLLIQQNRLSEAQQILELLKLREIKELKPNQSGSQTPVRKIPISDAEKQSIARISPEVVQDITPTNLPQPDRLSSTNYLNRSAQALLTAQPNSALIYQLFTKDKLWIILITPDGKLQRFSSIANQVTIESLAAQFRQQVEQCEKINYTCDKTDTQNLNKTSQQLYQQLFPPDLQTALQAANPQHLTFALDGTLRNIPMAALHTGQQYLVEQYTLSTIIAAQLTDSQAKLPPNPTQTPVLAVGTSENADIPVPSYISDTGIDKFLGLSNVPIELAAILKSNTNPTAFPGQQLLNDQFTLPNLQQKLPQHRILHISSHGIFRPNSLDYSYILLGSGPDRKWSIANIDSTNRNLFQNIHLVSLSTCQSNLSGRDKNGIEIAGMSHAFLSQGVKTVTASLWQVDDASTALLMQHFYQNLAAHPNQTKAESLHQAQLRLMKTSRPTLLEQFGRSLSDPTKRSMADIAKNKPKSTSNKTPDYSHPYYWAAFTLIGNSL